MDSKDPIIRSLLEENEEFRSLFSEHEELENKLAKLDSIHYLTPQQEIERNNIKKIKLRGMDRMQEIINTTAKRTTV